MNFSDEAARFLALFTLLAEIITLLVGYLLISLLDRLMKSRERFPNFLYGSIHAFGLVIMATVLGILMISVGLKVSLYILV
jgi:ATP/ADP translocase